MASLSLVPSLFLAPTTKAVTLSHYTKHRAHTRHFSKISCSADDDDEKLSRRDVVMGLGGLYGAAGVPGAMAAPIQAPDLFKAKERATDVPKGMDVDCRAPAEAPIAFQFPKQKSLRVRPAAHLASREYIEKFEFALSLMKALPDDDPRSFSQQAKIHCAYCNGGYNQVNYHKLDIQVHSNWLFFPFHRWCLYFFERILGHLIGDQNFAIPFWNWDAPEGMEMPEMFTRNTSSPLYDEFRNPLHEPPYVMVFTPKGKVIPREAQIKDNLAIMYRQMVQTKTPSLFFGGEYRAGQKAPDEKFAGTIEANPHNTIHILTGTEVPKPNNLRPPRNGEDMGIFYSAGRDPIFYALHGNIDRMWNLWKDLPGTKEINDKDWLDASFVFYDEYKNLVKVTVRDSLDINRLGYAFEDVPIKWNDPALRSRRSKPQRIRSQLLKYERTTSEFPLILSDSPVTVVVPRPRKGRSKEEEEVLVIKDIEYDNNLGVKFDVYINDEDGTSGANDSEFAGSFITVPQSTAGKVSLKLGVTDLLEDLGVDNEEEIVVTLFPRTKDPITIGGVKIELIS